ncbi:adenosylcobinamide amidohydrolase domain protein [Leptospira interrogans serovar Australis str. 200703203]|uniref:Adenosylcobinamide amidohydrolase domain protein n=1 Tax=Leptospira interrogans serovar Australis str. 200703203 TaxID=1085541 RepID=N1UQ82_LEPIR|nr:adenosylcobinamide amidohydrolase domain protein [Leptospira interrogans serovar Australis str. 200703203]
MIYIKDSWLEVNFEEPHNVLSWALIGGGWKEQVDCVLWHRVKDEDLTLEVDPIDYFYKSLLYKKNLGMELVFLPVFLLKIIRK